MCFENNCNYMSDGSCNDECSLVKCVMILTVGTRLVCLYRNILIFWVCLGELKASFMILRTNVSSLFDVPKYLMLIYLHKEVSVCCFMRINISILPGRVKNSLKKANGHGDFHFSLGNITVIHRCRGPSEEAYRTSLVSLAPCVRSL